MDAVSLNKFKNILNESIKKISTQVVDLQVDSDGDEYDEVQASAILDFAYATKDRNTNKLNSLVDALNKIDSDEYGLCEECGEEIDIRRLEIFPDAKYCIRCAEKIEKENGRRIF